jgi:hypothetical protein
MLFRFVAQSELAQLVANATDDFSSHEGSAKELGLSAQRDDTTNTDVIVAFNALVQVVTVKQIMEEDSIFAVEVERVNPLQGNPHSLFV